METFKAEIYITLRKGILDVQGKTVERALHSIDFPTIGNVRIGKLVELTVEAENAEKAKDIAEDASAKLIANPIIEDFEIKIKE